MYDISWELALNFKRAPWFEIFTSLTSYLENQIRKKICRKFGFFLGIWTYIPNAFVNLKISSGNLKIPSDIFKFTTVREFMCKFTKKTEFLANFFQKLNNPDYVFDNFTVVIKFVLLHLLLPTPNSGTLPCLREALLL